MAVRGQAAAKRSPSDLGRRGRGGDKEKGLRARGAGRSGGAAGAHRVLPAALTGTRWGPLQGVAVRSWVGERLLAVLVMQIPFAKGDEDWSVVAVEGFFGGELPADGVPEHAHQALGTFTKFSEARRVAARYEKAWRAVRKLAARDAEKREACDCKPIDLKAPPKKRRSR